MGKFIAKLTGESDGHTVVRHFDNAGSAKAWLQGDGLTDFDDQAACGEVHSESGEIVWRKSHLQTADRANRDSRAFSTHLLARVNLKPKK